MFSTIAKANYLSQSWQVLRSLQTPPAWGMSMTHVKNNADLKSNDNQIIKVNLTQLRADT